MPQPDLRVVARGERRGTSRFSDRALAVFLAMVAAVVLLDVTLGTGSAGRALRRLPEEQRQALLSRAVEDLRASCGDGHPAALDAHCRERATFASQFRECTGECQALVRHQLTPVPTR